MDPAETGLVTALTLELNRLAGPLKEDLVEILRLNTTAKWRLQNEIRVARAAAAMLDEAGVSPEALTPRLREIVPIMEAAGQEDDPTLQDMWAGLLASSLDPSGTVPVGVDHHKILQQLSPAEARFLNALREPDWSLARRDPRDLHHVGPSIQHLARQAEIPWHSHATPWVVTHLERLGLIYGNADLYENLVGAVDAPGAGGQVNPGSRRILSNPEMVERGVFLTQMGRSLLDACRGPSPDNDESEES